MPVFFIGNFDQFRATGAIIVSTLIQYGHGGTRDDFPTKSHGPCLRPSEPESKPRRYGSGMGPWP